MTGHLPAELENPDPSTAVSYLLGHFYALSQSRQMGMSLNPLLFSEIEAYTRLFGIALDHWEIEAIKQLDMIYLNTSLEE